MGRQTDKTEKQQKTIFQSTCSPKGGSWLLRSLWRCPWRQSRCDLEEGATGTRGAVWHSLTNKALVAPRAVTPPATKQRHSYLTLPYLGVLELLWDHISLLGFVTDAWCHCLYDSSHHPSDSCQHKVSAFPYFMSNMWLFRQRIMT